MISSYGKGVAMSTWNMDADTIAKVVTLGLKALKEEGNSRLLVDAKEVQTIIEENARFRREAAESMQRGLYSLAEIRKALGLDSADPTDVELERVEFRGTSRFHNWRNYVCVQSWARLSPLERLIDYDRARRAADAEEWE
jgi:hypothetical protein